MTKSRVEAFSDGVIAILITIMVLELRPPHSGELAALRPLLSTFLAYVLSFVYLGIYWSNHHHLFHAIHRMNGAVLWANLHLLFWLSMVPFTTAWMGENHNAPVPTAVYGAVLLMASIAYYVMVRLMLRLEGPESQLAAAVGNDVKGRISTALYVLALPLAFVHQAIADLVYVVVALIWLIPDRRIESRIS